MDFLRSKVPGVPAIPLSESESGVLQIIRTLIPPSYYSPNQQDLWKLVRTFTAWEFKRKGISAPYPEIVLVQEQLLTTRGKDSIAGFTLRDGKPTLLLALNHPVIRQDPAELPISIFHETHHYPSWTKDPKNYEREKGLPP